MSNNFHQPFFIVDDSGAFCFLQQSFPSLSGSFWDGLVGTVNQFLENPEKVLVSHFVMGGYFLRSGKENPEGMVEPKHFIVFVLAEV